MCVQIFAQNGHKNKRRNPQNGPKMLLRKKTKNPTLLRSTERSIFCGSPDIENAARGLLVASKTTLHSGDQHVSFRPRTVFNPIKRPGARACRKHGHRTTAGAQRPTTVVKFAERPRAPDDIGDRSRPRGSCSAMCLESNMPHVRDCRVSPVCR